ncbi:unnamed protein product [Caenorhabditis brenneri]
MQLMQVSHVVLLSMCSAKTRNMIGKVRWNVESYEYKLRSKYNGSGIDTLINSFHGGKRGVSLELSNSTLSFNKEISRWRLNDQVEIEIGKQYLQCGRGPFLETEVNIELAAPFSQRELALSAFHDYIVNLFGSCSKVQLSIENCHFHSTRLPIEGVSDITLSGENVKTDYFEKLLTKYPNQNSISIYTFLDREPNIRIFKEIKNIFWRTSIDFAGFALQNFNGNNMVLRMANIDEVYIHWFLHGWVTNKKYQNLETISIKSLSEGRFHPELILEGLTTFPYDPSRRPENYEYDRKIAGYEPEREDNFKCSDFLDIERKSDKKLASLKITGQWFWFCVWK